MNATSLAKSLLQALQEPKKWVLVHFVLFYQSKPNSTSRKKAKHWNQKRGKEWARTWPTWRCKKKTVMIPSKRRCFSWPLMKNYQLAQLEANPKRSSKHRLAPPQKRKSPCGWSPDPLPQINWQPRTSTYCLLENTGCYLGHQTVLEFFSYTIQIFINIIFLHMSSGSGLKCRRVCFHVYRMQKLSVSWARRHALWHYALFLWICQKFKSPWKELQARGILRPKPFWLGSFSKTKPCSFIESWLPRSQGADRGPQNRRSLHWAKLIDHATKRTSRNRPKKVIKGFKKSSKKQKQDIWPCFHLPLLPRCGFSKPSRLSPRRPKFRHELHQKKELHQKNHWYQIHWNNH